MTHPDHQSAEKNHQSSRTGLSSGRKIAIGILAATLLFVTLALPSLVDNSLVIEPTISESDDAALSPSRQAELKLLRRDAQNTLAQVQKLKRALQEIGADQWDAEQFNLALQHIEEGDSQYTRGRYDLALAAYQQSHDSLKALNSHSKEVLRKALDEGIAAIEAGDLATATEALTLVKQIAPKTISVSQALVRLETLPKVIDLLQQGDQALQTGELEAAEKRFAEAARADNKHLRARQLLTETRQQITARDFKAAMSQGYQALSSGNYTTATHAFRRAQKIIPGNTEASQALAQANNQQAQNQVNRQLDNAKSLEKQERWQEALAIYTSLLKTDPSLTDATVRQVPVQVRAELDNKLTRTLENPLKLSANDSYRAAQQLLADAKTIRNSRNSGPRLNEQITQLENLLTLAKTAVNVPFVSDGITEVAIYRVANLGKFSSTSLTLRPGKYVAAGTRNGFRDVRVEFTITGEPVSSPIIIQCSEPI